MFVKLNKKTLGEASRRMGKVQRAQRATRLFIFNKRFYSNKIVKPLLENCAVCEENLIASFLNRQLDVIDLESEFTQKNPNTFLLLNKECQKCKFPILFIKDLKGNIIIENIRIFNYEKFNNSKISKKDFYNKLLIHGYGGKFFKLDFIINEYLGIQIYLELQYKQNDILIFFKELQKNSISQLEFFRILYNNLEQHSKNTISNLQDLEFLIFKKEENYGLYHIKEYKYTVYICQLNKDFNLISTSIGNESLPYFSEI